jgi:translocation and assembly module TamB
VGSGGTGTGSTGSGGSGTASGASSGPALTAGKYVAPNVYVGVQQGTGSEGSQAQVQVDITKHVQLKADVGTQSQVGVQFQMDY